MDLSQQVYEIKDWNNICLNIYKDCPLYDVKFLFTGDNLPIKAHKLLLALRSPVFKCMFYGALSSQLSTDNGITEIRIDDIKSHVFAILMKYVYTSGKKTLKQIDGYEGSQEQFLLEVLYAAKKYMLKNFEKSLTTLINADINVANASFYLEQSSIYEEIDRNLCYKALTNDATSFFSSPAFLALKRPDLYQFLSSDYIKCPEHKILKAAHRWAEHKWFAEGGQAKPDCKQIRDLLGDALEAIRFPLMRLKTFNNLVIKPKFLSESDIIEILLINSQLSSEVSSKFCLTPRNGTPSNMYFFVKEIKFHTKPNFPSIIYLKFLGRIVLGGIYVFIKDQPDIMMSVDVEQGSRCLLKAQKPLTLKSDLSEEYQAFTFPKPLTIVASQNDVIKITAKGDQSIAYDVESPFFPIHFGKMIIEVKAEDKTFIVGLIL